MVFSIPSDLSEEFAEPMAQKGILKIEGDTLTLCVSIGRTDGRPAEFAAPRNSGLMLMQFQRVKK